MSCQHCLRLRCVHYVRLHHEIVLGEELMLVLCNALPDAVCWLHCTTADDCNEQHARLVECIMCAVRRIVGQTLLSLLTNNDKASSSNLMNLQHAAAAAITSGQAFPKDILGLSRRPDQASTAFSTGL